MPLCIYLLIIVQIKRDAAGVCQEFSSVQWCISGSPHQQDASWGAPAHMVHPSLLQLMTDGPAGGSQRDAVSYGSTGP